MHKQNRRSIPHDPASNGHPGSRKASLRDNIGGRRERFFDKKLDKKMELTHMEYEYGIIVGFISFFIVVLVVNRKRRGKNNDDND